MRESSLTFGKIFQQFLQRFPAHIYSCTLNLFFLPLTIYSTRTNLSLHNVNKHLLILTGFIVLHSAQCNTIDRLSNNPRHAALYTKSPAQPWHKLSSATKNSNYNETGGAQHPGTPQVTNSIIRTSFDEAEQRNIQRPSGQVRFNKHTCKSVTQKRRKCYPSNESNNNLHK